MKYHVNSNAYDDSYIKITVDAWKVAEVPEALEARLITYEELTTDLGCSSSSCTNSSNSWLYNSNYAYWISSRYSDSSSSFWAVLRDGELSEINVFTSDTHRVSVRPIIVLPKSAL